MNIKELLGICNHKWKTLNRWVAKWSDIDGTSGNYYYTRQQCEKCGKEIINKFKG